MKLFLAFAIVYICIAKACSVDSLECIMGRCGSQSVVSEENREQCWTVSTKTTLEGKTVCERENLCDLNAKENVSLNSGIASFSRINNEHLEAEPDTPNGLSCFGCFESSFELCSQKLEEVNCVGGETRCLIASGTGTKDSIPSPFVTAACATENLCQGPADFDFFPVKLDGSAHCCSSSLCNNVTLQHESVKKIGEFSPEAHHHDTDWH
ncbi:uncharacterized protein LOC125448475 [Stegostoma tigrinum]|uniref:uncharacterized protein LOC125448475 n=1 Tax=Stegostoma tigrinum TaxID=3053191 RepID=UPI00287001C6|nr:uncharacterized protein LOC125448475 [Stegostoma tigrinum]